MLSTIRQVSIQRSQEPASLPTSTQRLQRPASATLPNPVATNPTPNSFDMLHAHRLVYPSAELLAYSNAVQSACLPVSTPAVQLATPVCTSSGAFLPGQGLHRACKPVPCYEQRACLRYGYGNIYTDARPGRAGSGTSVPIRFLAKPRVARERQHRRQRLQIESANTRKKKVVAGALPRSPPTSLTLLQLHDRRLYLSNKVHPSVKVA